MNTYFALIYLNKELKAKLTDSNFTLALTHQKHMLEMVFSTSDEDLKLVVSTNPRRPACFLDAHPTVKQMNAASFFKPLSGLKLTETSVADNDRFLYLFFEKGYSLTVQLFGSKPNVFLTREGVIEEAYRDEQSNAGNPVPKPRSASHIPFAETTGPLKRRIYASYPFLQRPLVPDLIHHGKLSQKDDQAIKAYLDRVYDSTRNNPEFRRLSDGRFCLIPQEFIPDPDAETFDSINDAFRICFFQQKSSESLAQLKEQALASLVKEEKRLQKLEKAGNDAAKSLERAGQYEQFGQILLANAHIQPEPDADSFEAENFYDENRLVKIPIKKNTSMPENASWYFDKKKKAERSHEALIAQSEEAGKQLKQVYSLKIEVESATHISELKKLIKENTRLKKALTESTKGGGAGRPYLTTSAGKYEIWIGRNAKSNDALLRDAHKDDVWLHARGVSGSHVVIRMNKSTHAPDKSILETAASWAAWKSKARGAEMVPVIWTSCKYVRKPKGAQAGTVHVDKENVIMASPSEPKIDYFTQMQAG